MRPRTLVSLAAAVTALLLSAGRAAADPPGVRYGLGIEGGPFIVPGLVTLGFVGPRAHAGVRSLGPLSVYVEGSIVYIAGEVHGLYPSAALLAEFEVGEDFTVGGGPAVGFYKVSQSSGVREISEFGSLYGGKLHFNWYAVRGTTHNFIPGMPPGNFHLYENLLTLGFELRLVGRSAGFTGVWNTSGTASTNPLALLPTFSLSWHTFVF